LKATLFVKRTPELFPPRGTGRFYNDLPFGLSCSVTLATVRTSQFKRDHPLRHLRGRCGRATLKSQLSNQIIMCCFSGPVKSVHSTNIFARVGDGDRQFIVYSMSVDAPADLAMILPLPVKTPAGEKDAHFIDLHDMSDFFMQVDRCFLPPRLASQGRYDIAPAGAAIPKFEVVQVGNFDASFVPTEQDFSRLDERFRLPNDAWKKLPEYKDFGFAVFKLKAGHATIDPMAFSFPRRNQNSLFFPTVHIHDGEVHSNAAFEHALYCQEHPDEHLKLWGEWQESRGHPRRFVFVEKTKGIVAPDQHCYKRELRGNLPNKDTYVAIERL
jgi:hypothetical protein